MKEFESLFQNFICAPFTDEALKSLRDKNKDNPTMLSLIDECIAARKLLNGPATLIRDKK